MSKEVQSKRRYTTVIGRLLGKQRPSRWHVNRQQRKTSFPNYQFGDFSNSRSSSSNQEEFKDVYVDVGESNNANRRSSSKWSANSMLTKHELTLIQQNVEASSSHGSHHITVLKPSNSIKYESNSKSWNSETSASIISHLPRRDGLLLEPHNRNKACVLRNSSKIQLEEKNEEKTHLMKIVVLKPNLKKMHNGVTYDKLRKIKEDPISNEARQIARRSTRRLRDGYNENEFGGYEGDVSSYEANGSDSRFSSRKYFGDSKMCRYPSPNLAESSVNNAAKHRICERWKITHRYQDLELVANDITLGEMLVSDRGSRSICISSKDGWKVEKTITSSRSRSLPPSKDKKSYKISKSNNDKFAEDKYLMYSDAIRKDGFSYKDSKSWIRKTPHCRNIFINEMKSCLEANFEIQMEANVKDASKQQLLLQMAADDDTFKITGHNGIMIKEASDDKAAQNQKEELHKGPPEQVSPLQCLESEPDSSASSKDADCERESPVSILEVPFPGGDTSSSSSSSSSYQCFERVSAELNELRMHLESLKIESGDIASMDEEFVEFSPIHFEGNYTLRTKDWESCYTLDVLIASDLEERGFDMFRINWHSPDCPLNPTLFDGLENKYGDETTGLWSERKFLFDRINFALVEIFQEHVDLLPWVMTKLIGVSSCMREKDWVRVALQEKMNGDYAGRAISERDLDQEMQWSDCRGEIEVIGNEIETLLINDLIAEIANIWLWEGMLKFRQVKKVGYRKNNDMF